MEYPGSQRSLAPQIDSLANQQRSDPVKWGRRVYLCILALLAVAVINYLIGDALVLRADGIVLTDRYAVSATYPGRVTSVLVARPGKEARVKEIYSTPPEVAKKAASMLR